MLTCAYTNKHTHTNKQTQKHTFRFKDLCRMEEEEEEDEEEEQNKMSREERGVDEGIQL